MLIFQSEMRLKAEALLREQLTQDVKQLTSLIDALTSVSSFCKTVCIPINGVNSYDIQLGNSASKNKTILTTSILIIFQDIIQTQEEYNTLKSEYSKYREETRQEIRAMKVLNVKLLQLSRY